MAPSQTTPIPPRSKRFGRYRLLEMIGRGGMAEVYRAVAHGPGGFQRQFVLKRIRAEKAESSDFVDMFINEARISALLEHPNIVQVYDFGEVEGDYFLAMEYLRGKDLLTMLRHLRSSDQDLPIGVAAYTAMETARGLAYAHGLCQGGKCLDIVHRDVTPSNIMLLKTGGIKLLDFGIARAAMKMRSTTPSSGLIKGKFAYLSPEQVRGKGIDGRSDIFSLGVVLWECLTGQRLFWDPNDLNTMRNILEKAVPPPSLERPGLPTVLDDIVLRALERDPDKRFANAAALADALSGYLTASRFSQDQVARLLEETFGSESFNDDPLPDLGGSPIPPPPPTPRTLIAQARAGKTATEIAEEESGYSVVTSVRPLSELQGARKWRALALGAAAAIVLSAGGAALALRKPVEVGAPAAALPARDSAPVQPAAPAPPQPPPSPEPPTPEAAPAPPEAAAADPAVVKPALRLADTKAGLRKVRPAPIGTQEAAPAGAAPPAAMDLAAAKDARARGLEALASGQVQKAKMALEAALPQFPQDAEVLGGLSEAAFEIGDLNTARTFARKATASAPRVLKHQLLLGDVCLKMEKLKDAVDAYRAASALAPTDASVRGRLARAEAALAASPP